MRIGQLAAPTDAPTIPLSYYERAGLILAQLGEILGIRDEGRRHRTSDQRSARARIELQFVRVRLGGMAVRSARSRKLRSFRSRMVKWSSRVRTLGVAGAAEGSQRWHLMGAREPGP